MLYNLGRGLFRLFFGLACRWEVEGRENLPKTGGVILAPNHISYLDPPLAGSAVKRPVYFMAKRELFAVPILGWLIRRTHAFPVSRGMADRQAMKKGEELLREGKVLVMFPEGTRSQDGRLQKGELGVALIAARAKVPIVPMALIGSDKALPRASIFLRPAKIKVRLGAAICFDPGQNPRICRETLEPFADKIMQAIRGLLPAEMGGGTLKEEKV